MKLSDAIRAGCKQHEASEVGWDDRHPETGKIRTCAMVAALVGEGFVIDNGGQDLVPTAKTYPVEGESRTQSVEGAKTVSVLMPEHWRAVAWHKTLPPCSCSRSGVTGDVIDIITHLHDIHRWSREAAAEWVGIVEEKLETEKSKLESAVEVKSGEPAKCAV